MNYYATTCVAICIVGKRIRDAAVLYSIWTSMRLSPPFRRVRIRVRVILSHTAAL